MSKRDEYTKMMEERLELWNARLGSLRSHPDLGPKIDAATLAKWQMTSAGASAELAQLKATIGDAWDVSKLQMDKTWSALEALLAAPAEAKDATKEESKEPSKEPSKEEPAHRAPISLSKLVVAAPVVP